MFFFSKFMLNMNHLTPAIGEKLPVTDSRLRADIRAVEYGDEALAEEEKSRLEVN